MSEELSAPEIDAWLDGLPARQRVLALLLYAAGLTQQEMAEAVGLPVPALPSASHRVKTDLLKFFRAETDSAPPPPVAPGQAIRYREAGQGLAALLQPGAAPPATVRTPSTVRITGISNDVYAGWSLLATVRGLPAERTRVGNQLVESDRPGRRRMIVVAADDLDPHDASRRSIEAFAIDADKQRAGMRCYHPAPRSTTRRAPDLAQPQLARSRSRAARARL